MTEEEIRRQMDVLDSLIGTWHAQINDIAAREAAAAIASHPQPYSNSQLTTAKDRLIQRSQQAIDALQALHDKLVG